MRIFLFSLGAFLFFLPAAQSEENARILLREQVTISGPDIHLADLFQGISDSLDTIVARAPAPGQKVVFEARYLQSLARSFQLDWQAQSRFTRCVVTRNSKEILPQNFIEALNLAIHALPQAPEKFTLDFPSERLHAFLPVDASEEIQVSDLRLDPQSNTFSAALSLRGSDAIPLFSTVVQGHLQPVVSLPVFNQTVAKDTIIREEMLTSIDWPLNRLPANSLTHADAIIGKSATRLIKPNQILRQEDFLAIPLIKRGDIVLISFTQGDLHLTARARALENGTLNESIKLVNINTQRPLEGTVKASGLVEMATQRTAMGK